MGVNDEAIWRKHSGELVRFASVLVGPGDAEDLLSSVVMRVLSSRGSLESLDKPRPYLFRALVNEAKNHRRRSRRAPLMTEDHYSVELRPEVLDAVMGLPTQQRAAVYLTYWRDLPISETSELLGCRPGTVKRYLFLARNRLKELLSDA